MSIFQFSEIEALTFFAVLVRYSVLIAVLPFVGNQLVPGPIKVLLALSISIALFPALVASGQVQTAEAAQWGASAGGIVATIGLEAVFGLLLGFTARLIFDAIHFAANLAGSFMGFAIASTYDPHQEVQTQVVAELQMAIAMLLFLVLDGHHLMLQASLDSYAIVGIGKGGLSQAVGQHLLHLTGQVVNFGIQIAAPIAISLFAVNVAFGVIAKAVPQLNVLVLSFAVTAFIGLFVMLLGLPAFHNATSTMTAKMGEWLRQMSLAAST